MRSITAYTDYKSPYAYLAKDLTYALERDFAVHVDWLPYVLDIPAYLGSARVDAEAVWWKRTVTRTSGAVCATATWIAVARRANAGW
jgi:2-hydroxychromene-2-carboxylate isomerase